VDARTQKFLTQPPLGLLFRMATPSTLAFFIQSSVSLAEVWFIGQLGAVSLAAIALAFPVLMLTQTMSGGAMGGAVASAIARAIGAGDIGRAEQLIWHSLVLAVAGAMLFLATFLIGGEWFLHLLGGRDTVLAESMSYVRILLVGGVSIWMLGISSAIYRGMGDMGFPAMMMVVGAAIQVPLSGCLILGAFGFPELGIVGAAISAVVSGFVVSGILITNLLRGSGLLTLRWSALVLSRANFRDIMKVAMPASLSPLLTVSTVLLLTALVGTFGQNALAGYGIGSRVEFLIIPLVFGLGSSMTSLVGMSIGAGNFDRAERVGWIGGTCAGVIAGLVGLSLAIFPDAWISQFTMDAEVHSAAKTYIQIVGPCFFFQGIGLALYFASQGAHAMFWPVIATILRFVLAGTVAWLLAFQLGWGLDGIFYAAATAMTVYALVIVVSLKLGAWRE